LSVRMQAVELPVVQAALRRLERAEAELGEADDEEEPDYYWTDDDADAASP
jgi:hypothetical protein